MQVAITTTITRINPNDDQYEVGIQRDFGKDWQIFQYVLAIWQLRGGEGE